jgi:hypothetical protein
MRIAWIGIVALALSAPALAEDTAGPPTTLAKRDPADDALATAIAHALADDERVNAMKIKVAVDAGVVTLTGAARDIAAKDAAEAVVRRVGGVRDVRNQLDLTRPGEPEPGTSVIPEMPSPPR